jgi:hypothetical protein
MSFFSSLFGKKNAEVDSTSQEASKSDLATAPVPAPTAEDILNPPPVERKPFEVPASEADASAQTPVAPVVSDAQTVAESLGGAVSVQTASQVLASSEPVAPVASPEPPAPAAPPVSVTPELLAQMDTDLMTAEDIIAAYKIFLRRRPENMEGVTPRVGLTGDRILFDYLMSDEFTGRPEVAQLVFNSAKKILDAKKAADDAVATAEGSAVPASEPESQTPIEASADNTTTAKSNS